VRVEVGLLGRVDFEDNTPNAVHRFTGEGRITLAGAVVASFVNAEQVVHQFRNTNGCRGWNALPQAARAHVGTIGEVEHSTIVPRKVKEKIKKSSRIYI